MPRTLIVTNDFPPRRGGIQSFVHALATRLPEGTVTVYAPAWKGAAEFDARQPFPVIRHPTSLMLPVPATSRRAVAIAREHGCDTVLFGAAAPLGLITPALRNAGVRRAVALTHGHEAGWAALPHIPVASMEPGDLLIYNGEGHVAMYVGGGYIIDAPQTGMNVEKIPESTSWYADSLDGVLRP